MKKECSRCGSTFECQTKPICWCSTFPPLPNDAIDEEMDCMCKTCLTKTYFERIFSINAEQ